MDKATDNKRSSRRQAPISYRPPEALKTEFHRRVEKSGLSISGFITKAIFDQMPPRQSRRSSFDKKQLARLLIEVGRIREQLTQLSSSDNGGTDIETAIAELSEIRNAILHGMGRAP